MSEFPGVRDRFPTRREIRLNRGKGCLIEIGKREFDTNTGRMMWHVTEIETGQQYKLNLSSISNALTEMEVIAWAAQ
jgi:hypothetical protein